MVRAKGLWHSLTVAQNLETPGMEIHPDSLLLPGCVYRPGSFSGLMLLYESNYLKLQALLGELDAGASRWISRVRGDSDLYLETVLIEPYTTTLRLTYWLPDGSGKSIRDPDLTVRIYRDAGQAEALRSTDRHRHELWRRLARTHAGELGRRWRRNIMLNKWLDYLLERGHGFC
jgi:uncharacterized protein YqiB (DUF1249 family)